MKKNLNSADRVIRIVLAIMFASPYLTGIFTGTWGLVLLLFGVVFLITGMIGFCPLYAQFGITTCPVKSSDT